MGLAEKRIVKAYQEGTYQELVKEINTLAGFDLEIEVDWSSLSNNTYSNIWEQSFSQVYLHLLLMRLKQLL